MIVIACLHAAESNIGVFEEGRGALGDSEIRLIHRVENELLSGAMAAGKVTEAITADTRQIVQELCAQADAVIITCTTLGVVAEDAQSFSKPVLRVDAALAEVASGYEGQVVVLCSAPTTMTSTRELFSAFIAEERLSVALVPQAWARFMQQDISGYHQHIATSIRRYLHNAPGCIVLAQSSMAGAAQEIDSDVPLLTVPSVSLLAVVNLVRLKKVE